MTETGEEMDGKGKKKSAGHDMKSPCPECPFRNDLPHGYLRAERITEICESIYNGASFPCHKTTIETQDGNDLMAGPDSQQCAGAEIFLAKQGTSTQMSRIAERLGFHVATLDMTAPICGSHREMLKAHGHDEENEYESCHIADSGCLHPAGWMSGGGVIECTDGEETQSCVGCSEPVCEACSAVTDDGWLCNYCGEEEEES